MRRPPPPASSRLVLWLALAVAPAACGGDDDDALVVTDAAAPDVAVALDAGDDAVTATTTVVRVHYPAAGHTVTVRGGGGGLSWTAGAPTVAAGDDTFTFTFPALAAPIEWKPLLDDATWARGANYHVAPGATVDVYPHFTATHGQVITLFRDFASPTLGSTRTIRAYLPASYGENTTARYPVVYMHDGQNLFDPATAFGGVEWRVDESLDAAGEAGRCATGAACSNDGECAAGPCLATREAIVVGVDNTPRRIWELTPTVDSSIGDGGGADRYLTMLATELKPAVDGSLRTLPGPADTAIVGSSLGGLVSAYAGVRRADVFGLVGAMSPSTWWDDRVILADVAGSPASPRPRRVYVDSGDAGASMDGVADTRVLAMTYDQLGYTPGLDLLHVVQAGASHTELYWAQRFPAAAFFLLGPRP